MELNKNLKLKQEDYKTKVFWTSFQTIFIFGIPAFLGAFIGVKLDIFFQSDRKITLVILLLTFIFSWALIFIKYYKINKDLKK